MSHLWHMCHMCHKCHIYGICVTICQKCHISHTHIHMTNSKRHIAGGHTTNLKNSNYNKVSQNSSCETTYSDFTETIHLWALLLIEPQNLTSAQDWCFQIFTREVTLPKTSSRQHCFLEPSFWPVEGFQHPRLQPQARAAPSWPPPPHRRYLPHHHQALGRLVSQS